MQNKQNNTQGASNCYTDETQLVALVARGRIKLSLGKYNYLSQNQLML